MPQALELTIAETDDDDLPSLKARQAITEAMSPLKLLLLRVMERNNSDPSLAHVTPNQSETDGEEVQFVD